MNKNILSNIIMFAAGAAVGSAVTWKLMQVKCEQKIQDEVDAIRELYSEDEEDNLDDEDDSEDESRRKYKKIVESSGYDGSEDDYYFDEDDDEDEDEDEEYDEEEDGDVFIEPYVISPEEYDENGYDTTTLILYEDGVLENSETGEIIDEENIDELIGMHSLETFGKYEEDSVFVRNENLKTDFEILKDVRRYSEV